MKTPFGPSKYKSQAAVVRPWPDIEQHYTHLIDTGFQHGPFLNLIRHIIATRLSDRLFAYTSHDKLVTGIYNPMEWNREALHIEFDRHHKKWIFSYYSKPNEPVEIERQYPENQGIEKFDHFIRLLKW